MNPRRHSQIERAVAILDKSPTVAILREDPYLLFLFKKTERIVVALYIITGLFSDSEPLKWTLRESGATLLQHILSFKERATVHSKESLSDTVAEITRMLSLVELSHIADIISPMNFSVLVQELENLIGVVEGKWRTGTIPVSQPFFDDGFFSIPKEIFSGPGDGKHKNELSARMLGEEDEGVTLGSIAEFERLQRTYRQKDIYKGQHTIKDNVLNRKVGTGGPKYGSSLKAVESFDHAKEERKNHVLEILKKQGSAMIKDFSSVIQGCSEKTIQRLLVEMVQGGILKREGDRRWSRYSIATITETGNR